MVFLDEDLVNILKLVGVIKREDFEKIGCFGFGFSLVYYFIDVLSFISWSYVVFFDLYISYF